MRRVISILLENEAGSLSRVVGLFAQRGYNIETLSVAPTDDPTLSRLTLSTIGDDIKVEQIIKHLNRLVEVFKVTDLTNRPHVEREIMLIKLQAIGFQRAEIKRTTDIFRGQIVDVTASTYMVQLVGDGSKIDAFIAAVSEMKTLELVRSGVSGLARGESS